MAITPLCLRLEAPGGCAIEDYRIHNRDVEVRRIQGRTQDDCDWRQLTAEELTEHVYRKSIVAQWLERRLGRRRLLRACIGQQSLYDIDAAENTRDPHAA
jgi:hypothetical protein